MEGCPDRQGGPPPTRVHGAATGTGGARPELATDPGLLAPLPPSYDQALDRGLVALGLSLPGAARVAIAAHVRLLLAWNGAINLTAITDPEAIATRHVLDSLTAAALLDDAGLILDLGSGGGFPGLPLAAVLPGARVTLLESVAKKARFLEVAVAGAGLADRVTVLAARAETVLAARAETVLAARAQTRVAAPAETVVASRSRPEPGWDAVVARGVADLAQLLELAMPLLRRGGRLVAWKRGELAEELEAAARAGEVLGAGDATVHPVPWPTPTGRAGAGLEGHVLVEIRKIRPTPAGYPRDPASRRRRPW